MSETPTSDLTQSPKANYKGLIWVIAGVVVLYFGSYILIVNTTQINTKPGEVGDTFGAINALFSGLAFVGLIFTITQQNKTIEMQSNDLKLQQKAIALQTQELADTRKEFEEQNATMQRQRFDNTFYEMLRFQNVLIKDLKYSEYEGSTHYAGDGKHFFNVIYYRICRALKFDPAYQPSDETELKIYPTLYGVMEEYYKVYDIYEFSLGQYFRFTYQILLLIDKENHLTDEEKFYYSNQLRAQFSNYELIILLYNCQSKYGEKLKGLIEKYSLLKHIRDKYIMDLEIKGNFDSLAFASSEERLKILSDRATANLIKSVPYLEV